MALKVSPGHESSHSFFEHYGVWMKYIGHVNVQKIRGCKHLKTLGMKISQHCKHLFALGMEMSFCFRDVNVSNL